MRYITHSLYTYFTLHADGKRMGMKMGKQETVRMRMCV